MDRAAAYAAGRPATAEEIIARRPDIIIGSWCGKKFRPEKLAARAGFEQIPAVRNRALYEIKSPIILQPGPAALTDGLKVLQTIIEGLDKQSLHHRLKQKRSLGGCHGLLCILTAALVVRKCAHGKTARQRSMVVESSA
jgi:Periplasmic binding protein